MFLALKARNDVGGVASVEISYSAPSALPNFRAPNLGALTQAITFRAFGAEVRNLHLIFVV
jgi:hypothetical protein